MSGLNTFPQRSPQPSVSRRSFLRSGFGVAGLASAAGLGTGGYALADAAYDLRITEYRLTPPRWTAGPLSITVIADIHAGGPNMGAERIRQVVDAANALKSDLTVLLGDYIATHRFVTEHVPSLVWGAELGRLKAPLGVFAILGNHDWWHDIRGARAGLAGARIPVLENDAVPLRVGAGKFWLAGLGDQIAIRLGRGTFRGVDDLPGTLRKIAGDEPVLLLVHEPDIFTEVPERVSLTLAGHTHGGQLRVPFLWPAWVPSAYGARFAYGHVVEGGRHMIVSGGIGCSNVPMRLGVPPEIVRTVIG